MKDKSTINFSGFSTIEIVIALAVLSSALVLGMYGTYSGQYWREASSVRLEAVYENQSINEELKKYTDSNFYNSTSSDFTIVDPNCIQGNLCYYSEIHTEEISICLKNTEITTQFKLSNYPTTSINSAIYPINTTEYIKNGGDCILKTPSGNWNNTPQSIGYLESPGLGQNDSKSIGDYIYIANNNSPTFVIYKKENDALVEISTFDVQINNFSTKINAFDIYKNYTSNRTYVFATLATSTKQLAVLDITDPENIQSKSFLSFKNVNPSGSFPQGYKVLVYDNRVYAVTRETSGYEFHIFNIENVDNIFEIGNGFELNRTVNEILVRDQMVNNQEKRLVFLASDSNIKELSILDVTNDVVSEINSINLPGNQDGLSLFSSGELLYLGRSSNTQGGELYAFNIKHPQNPISILSQAEVSANVNHIKASGEYIFLSTNRAGETFQVWDRNHDIWNSTLNTGRLNSHNFPNLNNIELNEGWISLINNSTISDKIQLLKGYE